MILRWLGQHRANKAREAHASYSVVQELHDREMQFREQERADRFKIEEHENTIKALRQNRAALAESLNACRLARDLLAKGNAELTAERDELQLRVQSLCETIATMEREAEI